MIELREIINKITLKDKLFIKKIFEERDLILVTTVAGITSIVQLFYYSEGIEVVSHPFISHDDLKQLIDNSAIVMEIPSLDKEKS